MRITELTDLDAKADAETKTLRDVAILGSVSRNGRRYSPGALQDAIRVFEGARVFANHREERNGKIRPHDVRDYVGRISGLFLDGDMVRAREMRVVNSEFWPLIEAGLRDPGAFGLSIDGNGRIRKGVVESIKSARSVDLVSDPATVSGLFEQEEEDDDMNLSEVTIDDLKRDRSDLVETLVKEITLDDLKRDRTDLVETLLEEVREQVKASDGGSEENGKPDEKLREELGALTVKLVASERRTAITEALSGRELPDELREAAQRCESDDKAAKLIEAHFAMIPRGSGQRPRSAPASSKPDEITEAALQRAWGGGALAAVAW